MLIGYAERVESSEADIIACPPDRRVEALSLVLCDIAPSQRREVAGALWGGSDASSAPGEGLFIACRGGHLCGAVWGQRQPGNTAILWPPQILPSEGESTALGLAQIAVRHLDRAGIAISQVLLPAQDTQATRLLTSVGFVHLADLLYLTCEAERFAANPLNRPTLRFLTYDPSQRDRLMRLIERTYEGTLDCPRLNGIRRMEDVLDGYQATGVFRNENWLIFVDGAQDVGVLLLADHPSAGHWELVYMGLVPEARGRRWGRQITQHAQSLARRAHVERIVLAVDAANEPAVALYRDSGFEAWDRRSVHVRFCR